MTRWQRSRSASMHPTIGAKLVCDCPRISAALNIIDEQGRLFGRVNVAYATTGTIAKQSGVDVWNLVLLLQAGIRIDVIETAAELSTIIGELEYRDNYRSSDADWGVLFERFYR